MIPLTCMKLYSSIAQEFAFVIDPQNLPVSRSHPAVFILNIRRTALTL